MARIAMTLWDITEVDSKHTGGLERCMLSEAESLSYSGIQVVIATRRFKGPRKQFDVQEIGPRAFLGRRSFIGYYAIFVLRNLFANVYHAHNSPFLAVLHPAKALVHLHNEVRFPGYGKLRHRYRKAHYACCSRYIRSWLLNTYPDLDKSRVHVLYNGVDVKRFYPSGEKAPTHRPIRLLFAGQWNEKKGIFLLLQAVNRIQRHYTNFELWVAGSARLWQSKADQEKAVEIEDSVTALASDLKNVRLIGAVNHDKMADLYRSVDIMIVPSIWDEPLGIVALEAMASGLPVIAFPVGGIPEVVVDRQTGFLVQQRTPAALADAVASLLDEPENIHVLGAAARTRAEEHFSWQSHLVQLWKLYEQVNPALKQQAPVWFCSIS